VLDFGAASKLNQCTFGSEDNSEYLVRRAKVIFAENKAAILTRARNFLVVPNEQK